MPLADAGPWAVRVNGQAPASRGRLWYLRTVADTEVLKASVLMIVDLILPCGSEVGRLIQVGAMEWEKILVVMLSRNDAARVGCRRDGDEQAESCF